MFSKFNLGRNVHCVACCLAVIARGVGGSYGVVHMVLSDVACCHILFVMNCMECCMPCVMLTRIVPEEACWAVSHEVLQVVSHELLNGLVHGRRVS